MPSPFDLARMGPPQHGWSDAAFAEHRVSMRAGVPGSICILPAGTRGPLGAWSETNPFTVRLDPYFVQRVALEIGFDPERVALAPHLRIRDAQLERILSALKHDAESEHPVGHVYTTGLTVSLTAYLLKHYAGAAEALPADRRSVRRIRRVLDYIDENLDNDLRLRTLTSVCDISESRLKVLFRRTVGMPVHQYVLRRRIEHAVKLLSSGKRRVAEIAASAGFADQSHMARCMRRLTGRTPKDVIAGR
jgi:AraC family transcriptional regulator